jgi:hypothetical protein
MESLGGVLHGLFGVFVAAQVVFFSMVRGGGAVSVRGLFMEFRCYSMGVIWHGILRLFILSPQSRRRHTLADILWSSAGAGQPAD